MTATAAAVGVTRQTVSEWLNRDADFRAELNRVRKETPTQAQISCVACCRRRSTHCRQVSTRRICLRASARLGMALLKNMGLVQRASAVGSTNADDIRSSQVLSDMLNFAR